MEEKLNEQQCEIIFKKVYQLLPEAIHLLIKEDAFVRFCLENEGKIFEKELEDKWFESN